MNNLPQLLLSDVAVIKMQQQNNESTQGYFQNILDPLIKSAVQSKTFQVCYNQMSIYSKSRGFCLVCVYIICLCLQKKYIHVWLRGSSRPYLIFPLLLAFPTLFCLLGCIGRFTSTSERSATQQRTLIGSCAVCRAIVLSS